MNKIPKFLILAIIVAIFLRFWNLSTLPYPPDGDEVAFGYYGWSLLHFGTDEFGKVLPANFSSIGDFKYPALSYLNTIPAAIFGLNDITIRFWDALAGVLLVVIVYFLAQILFSNRKASIFSAWAVALSPWAIIVSRLGYETSIATVLATLGITTLLYANKSKVKKSQKILYLISFLTFLIAIFTYAAARFFIPCFLLIILLFSLINKGFLEKSKKILLIFSVIFISITFITILSPENRGRASEDVWKGISAIENNRLQELYIQAGTSKIKIPAKVTWALNNKYRIALFDFIDRYTQSFSISYLFTQGEAIGQRVPDMGVLLFIDILLLPAGIIALIKKNNFLSSMIITVWLILAPIPSALTITQSKMIRATLLIVPLSLLSGLGFSYLSDLSKKYKGSITIVLIGGFILSSIFSLNQIFIQKPLDNPWTYQEVGKDLTKTILNLKNNYSAVAMGGDDYIYFLFYGKISPSKFLRNANVNQQARWDKVESLYNIYFNMPSACPEGGKLNVLYVCKGGDLPQNSKIIKTFYYADGVPAYALIEFYPESQMPKALPPLPNRFHYMVDVETIYPDGIVPSSSESLW